MADTLVIREPWRKTWAITTMVVPGLGAMVLGWRNPHTRYLRVGFLQMLLFLFGSYPLLLGGIIAYAWAIPTGLAMLKDPRRDP